MDTVQILVSVAEGFKTSGINLIFSLAFFVGLGSCVMVVLSTIKRGRAGRPTSGMKAVVAVVSGSALMAIHQMMNKAAHTVGFGDVSLDAIAYAPESLGYAKLSVDAVLTLLRGVGFLFFYIGINIARRSLLEGHTGLSAREDIRKGMVMCFTGTLLACNPQLLDALQQTVKLTWN